MHSKKKSSIIPLIPSLIGINKNPVSAYLDDSVILRLQRLNIKQGIKQYLINNPISKVIKLIVILTIVKCFLILLNIVYSFFIFNKKKNVMVNLQKHEV